jgi:hypothetical protein
MNQAEMIAEYKAQQAKQQAAQKAQAERKELARQVADSLFKQNSQRAQ